MVASDWKFEREDQLWVCVHSPIGDENLAVAIETLVVVFGSRSWAVRDFLDAWDKYEQAGSDFSLNTEAATVKPLGEERYEIRDKYGQFHNVEIGGRDLRDALESLIATMDRYEQRSSGPAEA